jgi:hypothetical protein
MHPPSEDASSPAVSAGQGIGGEPGRRARSRLSREGQRRRLAVALKAGKCACGCGLRKPRKPCVRGARRILIGSHRGDGRGRPAPRSRRGAAAVACRSGPFRAAVAVLSPARATDTWGPPPPRV